MPLHTDYRPKKLSEFLGNRTTKIALKSLSKKNGPHSFLFVGPSGCGKTTLARLLSRRIGCSDIDFHEVDAADYRGIDSIREIRQMMKLVPLEKGSKVYLLDECHKMTNDAQNALLKALEDTPKHVYLMLATTEPGRLLLTIRNRCMIFEVNPLSSKKLGMLLDTVAEKEKIQLPEKVRTKLIETSDGIPRTALILLDKIRGLDKEQMLETITTMEETDKKTIELCRALIKRSSWKTITNIVKDLKEEQSETVRRAVLGYCYSTLLNKDDPFIGILMSNLREHTYDSGWPGLLSSLYDAWTEISTG